MSGIRARNTKPEMMVRRFLHANGLRYRLHVPDLPGRPDIVLPKYRTIVEVRGCFWHRHANCRYAATPKTNRQFWKTKLESNVRRDFRTSRALRRLGWRVLVVWECEVQKPRTLERVLARVRLN